MSTSRPAIEAEVPPFAQSADAGQVSEAATLPERMIPATGNVRVGLSGRDKIRDCLASPARIIIWRPDHLGDLILFSGALRHIRNRWPSSHITLAVHPYGRALFEHCPYIDELFPCDAFSASLRGMPALPGFAWLLRRWPGRNGSAYRRFHDALQCDLAIFPIVSPGWRQHITLSLLPAKSRIGICGSTSIQSHMMDLASRLIYSAQMDVSGIPESHPEMDLARHFMALLGIELSLDQLWPEFWTNEEDKQAAENLMGRSSGRRILGIAPGNANPGKRLPPQWFGNVMNYLDGEAFQVVLLGGPADSDDCSAISQALQGLKSVTGVLNLSGKTTVRQMIECVRRCDVVLTQETAALHMATALRKPVLGIVGGGHFGRFYPWGDPNLARTVTRKMDCFGCNWKCKYETMRCIQDIPPAEAARELKAC